MKVGEDSALWLAIEVLGNHDNAMRWLRSPCAAFGGAFPVFLARNTASIELVMEELEKISESVSA